MECAQPMNDSAGLLTITKAKIPSFKKEKRGRFCCFLDENKKEVKIV